MISITAPITLLYRRCAGVGAASAWNRTYSRWSTLELIPLVHGAVLVHLEHVRRVEQCSSNGAAQQTSQYLLAQSDLWINGETQAFGKPDSGSALIGTGRLRPDEVVTDGLVEPHTCRREGELPQHRDREPGCVTTSARAPHHPLGGTARNPLKRPRTPSLSMMVSAPR